MIATFNGCGRSNIVVIPANWNTKKATTKKPWRICYRFYDHTLKGTPEWGKQIQITKMNKFRNLEARQEVTRGLLANELSMLDHQMYNPITKYYMEVRQVNEEEAPKVSPTTPFLQVLEWARVNVKVEETTRTDMKSVLKYMTIAAERAGILGLAVKMIGRKDILRLFDNMKHLEVAPAKKNKPARKKIWTDNQHNHYRKYLLILFQYLVREEIIENNPIDHVPIKERITDDQHTRAVPTDEQRRKIKAYLKAKRPEFLRFIQIFFHSGARRTEIMKVQGKHVNLARRTFRVLVKKRKTWSWETKAIKDVALPYWQEIMQHCGPEDYVFSVGKKPGPKAIRPEHVTRQWRRHVKEALGVTADLYSLKHLNSTEMRDILESEMDEQESARQVAAHNSHTSEAMVVNIYDVKKVERKHRKIRGINNAL